MIDAKSLTRMSLAGILSPGGSAAVAATALFGWIACLAIGGDPCHAAPPADSTLPAFELSDHRGRVWKADDFLVSDNSVLVVAFLGTECPLAKLYSGRLSELADSYADRGVKVLGVVSNRQDSLQKIGAFVDRQAIEYPLVKDPGNRLADQLGAERTPEVFVFDGERKLRYWGRIDDQYGIGYAKDAPGQQDLKSAIDDVLAGRQVAVSKTRSVGCLIGRIKKSQSGAEVTYVNSVASILQNRCLECHREGEIAPFAMSDPEEIAGWAFMIAEVVREGRMPPWHASPEYGDFSNDRSMPEEEKEILYAWAEAGAPIGDLAANREALPTPPTFTTGWQLPREPDMVVNVSPEPFQVPATGVVRYQYFVVDTGLDEDVWLESAEILPGNRSVVHHVLAFTRPRGTQGGLDATRGFLVGYVPGARNEGWPAGMAKRIPGGSELVFQVHYTPVGTPQVDHSKLGLCFMDPEKVTHEVTTSSSLQIHLNIPPGDDNYKTHGLSPKIESQSLLLGMSPHMHVRGKAYRYELLTAAGARTTLLDIPNYDFNWQTTYVLRDPLPLSPGDRIFCTAVYDNSAKNLNNPNPKQTVTWGDQTWDEMMIGYFHYATPLAAEDGEGGGNHRSRRGKLAGLFGGGGGKDAKKEERDRMVREVSRLKKFEALDREKTGQLAKADVPAALLPIFNRMDINRDGILTREEVILGDDEADR